MALEPDDPRRLGRPRACAAAAADADPRGDDNGQPLGKELDVHASSRLQRRDDARAVQRRPRLVRGTGPDRRRHEHAVNAIALFALLAILAGCGGSSSPPQITVGAAQTYALSGFTPSKPVAAGKPVRVSFTILQPGGAPLTQYRHGAGPHNGVHLIVVRRDLSVIIHHHPPVGPNGLISDEVTFPSPGPYRVVIDVYPKTGFPPNYQLFATIDVAGAYHPQPLPPFQATQKVDGYTFTLHGAPHLRAIVPALLDFTVTEPSGKPVDFKPWFGALAHAIFFRRGSLDYFHTHVCAPGASGCTSVFGASKVTGTSSTPGRLKVGVLVPVAGTWKLFLQIRDHGHVLSAPFTLQVK